MTKEEAIYKAKHLRKVRPNIYVDAEDFWETVIAALEQEPCEDAISRQAYDKGFDDGLEEGLKVGACEDCIDRQYLVDKATSWDKHFDDSERYVSLTDIQNAPPVTPAEKVGHWTRELIRNEKGGCIGAKMICSRCGNDNRHDEYMNYCPNCGTKMEVEE
jgi:hypothetical protein